jgi:hypothetical protein
MIKRELQYSGLPLPAGVPYETVHKPTRVASDKYTLSDQQGATERVELARQECRTQAVSEEKISKRLRIGAPKILL